MLLRRDTLVLATWIWIGALAFAAAPQKQEGTLNEQARAECAKWLRQFGKDPIDYVVSKFSTHDVVLLGEIHEVKENCELVASLLEPLYKAGIGVLCTEFIPSRFNDALMKIITAKDYDQDAVIELFRKGPWPTWGYGEYMDIVRSAWALNRTLPKGEKPFRLVGIDSDWKQVQVLRAPSSAAKFKIVTDREHHMAEVVEREVLDQKAKALVHIGFAHTVRHGERMAAQLARKHGERLFQICLHHAMPGEGKAAALTSFLEDAVADAKRLSVGFDVAGSPFAALRDGSAVYFRMLGSRSTFQDIAQGYVLLRPAKELSPVRWVSDFIVAETFADAKAVAEGLGWVEKNQHDTPMQLEAALTRRLSARR